MTNIEIALEVKRQVEVLKVLELDEHEKGILSILKRAEFMIDHHDIIPLKLRIESLLALKKCLISDFKKYANQPDKQEALAFAWHHCQFLGCSPFAQIIGVSDHRVRSAYEKYFSELV